jgi:ribosomal protein S12 methylthiotransferase
VRRRIALMKEQAKISRRKNRARVGDVVPVLFEGESKESELLWQGRMETQAPDIDGCVLINDVPDGLVPAAGELVSVQITEAHEYDLIGRILATD